MPYPTNIADFMAALYALAPEDETRAQALEKAQSRASPVLAAVDVFDALREASDLPQDELRCLLGAAHLIATNSWHGRSGLAVSVVAQRVGQLE